MLFNVANGGADIAYDSLGNLLGEFLGAFGSTMTTLAALGAEKVLRAGVSEMAVVSGAVRTG